jgi:hypothetical protein
MPTLTDPAHLKVTVNESQAVHVVECHEALSRDLLQTLQRKVRLVAALAVVLVKFIEVVAKQLAYNEEVLLKVEIIYRAKHQ